MENALSKVLKLRRSELGLTLAQIAERMDVSEATVQRWESGAIKTMRQDKIARLAQVLGVSPSALMGWKSSEARAFDNDNGFARLPSPAGIRVGLLYDRANERDRKLVDTVLAPYDDGTLDRLPVAEEPRTTNVIPFTPRKLKSDRGFTRLDVYDDAATAGLGNYLDTPTSHIEQYPASMIPAGTDFGVRISGDSMEPAIPDGSTAFVQSRSAVEPGDIGIFLYNGQSYCKQLVIDRAKGQVRLHSLNPKYEDIVIREYDDLRTLGRVLGSY